MKLILDKLLYQKWLFVLLIAIGSILLIINKRNDPEWDEYINRAPRTLRIELAAPYDQVVSESGENTFVDMTYKSNDNNETFSMSPWREPNKSPVTVSYGFPEPIFELPPSTFVSVIFETAHVIRFTVKPMLSPLHKTETIELAKTIIEILDTSSLVKIPDDDITLEEVMLSMKLLAKDMGKGKFKIGKWKLVKPNGTVGFSLSIKVISDREIVDPADQSYGISLFIYGVGDDLTDKLESLRVAAREKMSLTDNGKPCTLDSYSCDIPDVRVYLDTLRKEKLIPLK